MDMEAAPAAYADATMKTDATEGSKLSSERELQLELMVRERDEHLVILSNQIRSLQRRMPQNIAENPSYDSSILVPASVVHSITPLIAKRPSAGASTATTVTNALTQRLAALQEENDELYTLLKRGTVGRLQEEVTELRTLSRKLEKALKESHTMISSLKAELEQAYRAIEARQGQSKRARSISRPRSPSPVNHYRQQPQSLPPRPIPTGPRALKKPRLSHDTASNVSRTRNGDRAMHEPEREGRRTASDAGPSIKDEESYNEYDNDYLDDKPVHHRSHSVTPERGRPAPSTSRARAESYAREYSYTPEPEPLPVVQRRSPTPQTHSSARRHSPSPRPPSSQDDRSPVASQRSPSLRRSRSPSRLRADYRSARLDRPPSQRNRDYDREYRSPAPSTSSRGYGNRDRDRDKDWDKGKKKRGPSGYGSKPNPRHGSGSGIHGGNGGKHSGSGGVSLASRIR